MRRGGWREERELVLIRDAQSYAQFSSEYSAGGWRLGLLMIYIRRADTPVGLGSRDGTLG